MYSFLHSGLFLYLCLPSQTSLFLVFTSYGYEQERASLPEILRSSTTTNGYTNANRLNSLRPTKEHPLATPCYLWGRYVRPKFLPDSVGPSRVMGLPRPFEPSASCRAPVHSTIAITARRTGQDPGACTTSDFRASMITSNE